MLTRLTAVAIFAVAAGLLVVSDAPGQQQALCFGIAPTITGSGIIVGTDGDDVILGSAGDDTILALIRPCERARAWSTLRMVERFYAHSGGKDLDRHIPAELRIACAIDLAL